LDLSEPLVLVLLDQRELSELELSEQRELLELELLEQRGALGAGTVGAGTIGAEGGIGARASGTKIKRYHPLRSVRSCYTIPLNSEFPSLHESAGVRYGERERGCQYVNLQALSVIGS
jgi:hypothetical protein